MENRFFRGRYQITNPTHVSTDKNKIKKIHSNYNLTEGISDNIFNKTINEALKNLPKINEWHSPYILEIFDNNERQVIQINLHKPLKKNNEKKYLDRLLLVKYLSLLFNKFKFKKNFKKKEKIPKK